MQRQRLKASYTGSLRPHAANMRAGALGARAAAAARAAASQTSLRESRGGCGQLKELLQVFFLCFFLILLWARAREREPGQGAKNMIVDFFVFCEQDAARRLRAAKKNQGAAVGVPHTAVYVIQAHSVADVSLLCCSALCGSVRLFFWLFVGLLFWDFFGQEECARARRPALRFF